MSNNPYTNNMAYKPYYHLIYLLTIYRIMKKLDLIFFSFYFPVCNHNYLCRSCRINNKLQLQYKVIKFMALRIVYSPKHLTVFQLKTFSVAPSCGTWSPQ